MNNYFDSEINNLNREILFLKTSGQKSAATVRTMAQSVSITVQLRLQGSSRVGAQANFEVTADSEALVMATLDKYFDDITINDHGWGSRTRTTKILLYKPMENTTLINIAFEGDNQDVITIRDQGGTVEMSTTLTVRCTDNFTLERIS